MPIHSILLTLAFVLLAPLSCSDRETPYQCDGANIVDCKGDSCEVVTVCDGATPVCNPQLGCVSCTPGGMTCHEDNVYTCNNDGAPGDFLEACDYCMGGTCLNACEAAADVDSYLGCRFLAVSTPNPELHEAFDHDFAVIIGNADGTSSVDIVIKQGIEVIATDTLAPGDVESYKLPMNLDISKSDKSKTVADGAYIVESSLPVSAYQFNPLHFSMRSTQNQYSYSNDASLLLPVHSFDQSYRVLSRPTWGSRPLSGATWKWLPGFATIVAAEDNTTVELRPTDPNVLDDSLNLDDDDKLTVKLDRGDVYQLFSRLPAENQENICSDNDWPQEAASSPGGTRLSCDATPYDLTGSLVQADKPIGVFAGHTCTFVPIGSWACDHLEEMMLPVAKWGTEAVMSALSHPDGLELGSVASEYRILAHEDDTKITISPQSSTLVELSAGESYTFTTSDDFYLESNEKQFLISQTMLGQHYHESEVGDPAMGIGVPLFQSRTHYSLLVPSTYTRNFINIATVADAEIEIDGEVVTDWTTIQGTSYKIARVPIEPGGHLATSSDSTGFTVIGYGYAPYTSYMYPGGLNLINYVF